jgi:16S rRNA (adenine1518-N6/adenine1519-N6)-dimethyltransferase
VSLRVQYHAAAEVLRRIAPSVFWPRPNVAAILVRLDRLPTTPVSVEPERLWRVVDAGFAERRKAIRSAVVRLGVDPGRADEILRACAVDPRARAERLSLEEFARIAEAIA